MGPVNDQMRAEQQHDQTDIKYPITWNTLAEGWIRSQSVGFRRYRVVPRAATPRVNVWAARIVRPLG